MQRVEVETHSYCNRRCGYCPNAAGDRLGPNVRMAEALYARIVGDLASIGLAETISIAQMGVPLTVSVKGSSIVATIDRKWVSNHPLTDFSLLAEETEWNKVGFDFKLIPV